MKQSLTRFALSALLAVFYLPAQAQETSAAAQSGKPAAPDGSIEVPNVSGKRPVFAAIGTTAEPKAEAVPVAPDPNLNCDAVPPKAPFLAILLKTRDGEKYRRMRLACMPLTAAGPMIDAAFKPVLDQSAEIIGKAGNAARVYLDMSVGDLKDDELESRYRRQAFAVKNYFTEKRVYDHLQKTRAAMFPPAFPADKPKTKPTKVAKKSAPVKPPIPRKPDPSKKYAYFVDKGDVAFPNDEPSLLVAREQGTMEFVTLESVYFVHGKDDLSERSRATLDAIAQYVFTHTGIERIIVRGHADSSGSARYNYRLTDRRATNVRDYLETQGVKAVLLEIDSQGEMEPTDENWTRPGMARNRRVELYALRYGRQARPTPVLETPPPVEPVPAPMSEPTPAVDTPHPITESAVSEEITRPAPRSWGPWNRQTPSQ